MNETTHGMDRVNEILDAARDWYLEIYGAVASDNRIIKKLGFTSTSLGRWRRGHPVSAGSLMRLAENLKTLRGK